MPVPRTKHETLPGDMTGDQLADAESARVEVVTKHGSLRGGRVKNGCQVFLNVPYGLDVPRWTDPKPLPNHYTYPDRDYIVDGLYCAQPTRYYTVNTPVRDRLGLGSPTENPFFADIYVPSFVEFKTGQPLLPVRVFIHGGFMQFGSTSGQHYNQQFFAAEQFGEIRVLLGHRVSVLGFLGASQPSITGNYGFKDCWLGLEWVRDNIAAFGGDPDNVHLSGLSGGGHITGQLIHYAARQAPSKAPFVTALLQSNAVLTDPVQPSERNFHVRDICGRLGIDWEADDVLDRLRDRTAVPTDRLIAAIQCSGDPVTFRGVAGTGGWVASDMMEFQRSGGLARGLRAAGVKCIISGDVRDERAFYRQCHPCASSADVKPHLDRFYPSEVSDRLVAARTQPRPDATPQECDEHLGRMLADLQVHLPVRLLAKDLAAHGFPSVRYAIELAAQSLGSKGVVSHGSDLLIQHYRLSMLTQHEANAALMWTTALNAEVAAAIRDDGSFIQRGEDEMLVLSADGETVWAPDWRLDELQTLQNVLRGV